MRVWRLRKDYPSAVRQTRNAGLRSMPVNETWYVTNYPDVAASVRKGAEPSAQAHFPHQATERGGCPIQCRKGVVSREREAFWLCRTVRWRPSQRSVQGDKISRPTWTCGKHAIL
jgi:hypothetical protein